MTGSANDVTALANGNYVVRSPSWDNGIVADAGAVTFGNGVSGVSGVVSEAEQLWSAARRGTESATTVFTTVDALSNGNYVVGSYSGTTALTDAGAVTFGSGIRGVIGTITSADRAMGLAATTISRWRGWTM